MNELIARVQALCRRTEPNQLQKHPDYCDNFLSINLAEQRVSLNGTEIRLTPTEFNLVHYLLTAAGRFAKPSEILNKVWGEEYIDDVDLLRTCIWQLRRKLEPDSSKPRYIVNRPGFGYMFDRRSSRTA
ncbi:winged helix-turn-helix domain-containing protein [Chloroflexota bacterium]